jgi:hypothetical protein
MTLLASIPDGFGAAAQLKPFAADLGSANTDGSTCSLLRAESESVPRACVSLPSLAAPRSASYT